MVVTFHFQDGRVFTKEIPFDPPVNQNQLILDTNEPPPSGEGIITGIEVEGILQKQVPGVKTSDMTLLFNSSDLINFFILVEEEMAIVSNTKKKNLPLLIGSLKTISGQKELEKRLRN